MSMLIDEGRYRARITSGLIENIDTFPSWHLELSFRLLGRANQHGRGPLQSCPEVERTLTTPVRPEMLGPVLRALGCHEHFWRQFEPGEAGTYGLEEGEVLVDCLHTGQGGRAEESWELATRPFASRRIEPAVRDAVLRLPDQVPGWGEPTAATRRP